MYKQSIAVVPLDVPRMHQPVREKADLSRDLSQAKVVSYVALITMPFASADRPSIQLGVLKGALQDEGAEVDLFYFNLELAACIGVERYQPLCEHRGHMTGEWLFSFAAFGELEKNDEDTFFDRFPGEEAWFQTLGMNRSDVRDLRRNKIPQYLRDCLASQDWGKYGLIGFSSTFQQNVASLAMARLIKEKNPASFVVLGGSNMEGDMGCETARAFPFIDCVVSGEGEPVIQRLLKFAADRGDIDSCSSSDHGHLSRKLMKADIADGFFDLDRSSYPDYSQYFVDSYKHGFDRVFAPTWALPIESSRGCWWGQKHHCTFCGLNGGSMKFRQKSAEKLLPELAHLSEQYSICSFEAVDNIVSTSYSTTVFDVVGDLKLDYKFFYEVKANIDRATLKSMRRGGVRRIQPGIESLNSDILQLMRKGATLLQNVRCLKWARYYGIDVNWNLLCGFPGEKPEDYDAQRRAIDLISHLEPPASLSRIWLERFSPYFSNKSQYPIKNIRPAASYEFVYPGHVDLNQMAYFFDYEMGDVVPDDEHSKLRERIDAWIKTWNSTDRDILVYRKAGSCLLIDSKKDGRSFTRRLRGPTGEIYEFCSDTARSVNQVTEFLANKCGYVALASDVAEALNEFCTAGLMISEKDMYLSLALPAYQEI